MPIPVRLSPFLDPGCPGPIYAGLARLSAGCPPDRGRLHTCYSPVRRSPAGKGRPSPLLPLDLHVLSLPLAFILSQDQTLRCLYCICFFFGVIPRVAPRDCFCLSWHGSSGLHDLLVDGNLCFPCSLCAPPSPNRAAGIVLWHICQCSLRNRSRCRGFVPDCGCKITTVSALLQIFFLKNAPFSEIRAARRWMTNESTYVKMCVVLLIGEQNPVSGCYPDTEMSRISSAPPRFSRFFIYICSKKITIAIRNGYF